MKIIYLLLLLPLMANAVDFDVSIGQTMWTPSDNGTWWQQPFKREWPDHATSYSIGVSDEISPWLRWNAGYSNLGTINSYGQAVGDDVYGATNNCTTGACPPPDDWYGNGTVDGVYFTLSPQVTYNDIIYSAEIGVWNYQPKSVVYVPAQHPCGLCNPPPLVNNVYFVTSSDRMWGQVFGGKINYKNLFFRARAYWTDSSDKEYPATYQKYTYEISIGYIFK